jgi:chromosome segregation ATPase
MVSLGIALTISLLMIGGAFFFIQRSLGSSVGAEKETLIESLKEMDQDLVKLAKHTGSFASRAQFDTLVDMVEQAQTNLEKEKASLKEIESRLDVSQKDVEQKEFQQQELKSAKEEDELKLQQLLESYENVSSESISLEQQLAESLKNLDTILGEINITDEQRAVFEDLNSQLSTSGGLLRELITEYNSVNERLNLLREQHEDLEDEYTRLVEQQLGE